MSTVILEGFDNWSSSADGTGKGWTVSGAGGAFGLVAGRYAGQAAQYTGGYNCLLTRVIASASQVAMGFAWSPDTTPNLTSTIFEVTTSATSTSCFLRYAGTQLQLVNAAGASTNISGITQPAANGWTYLEALFIAGASGTGTVKLYQDGALVYSNTAVSTCTTTASFDGCALGSPSVSGSRSYIDDAYVTNGSGTVNNSVLGPVRVCTLYPTADAGTPAWTPLSGSNCYSQVNETVEDGSTSYIYATANSQSAQFSIGSLPTGLNAPAAVQVTACANGLGNTLKTLLTSGGSGTYASSAVSLTTTFTNYAPEPFDTDPNTGSAWTTAGVNALEIGVENGAP